MSTPSPLDLSAWQPKASAWPPSECPQCGAPITEEDLCENGARADCPKCHRQYVEPATLTHTKPRQRPTASWAVRSGAVIVSLLVIVTTLATGAAILGMLFGGFEALPGVGVAASLAITTTFVSLFVQAVTVLEEIRDRLPPR